MKVIKRPPTFDAVQFVVSNWRDVLKFLERHGFEGTYQQSPAEAWVQFTGVDRKTPYRVRCDDYLVEEGGEVRIWSSGAFANRFEVIEK